MPKLVDLKITNKALATKIQSDRKLGNLPEDVALWLYWRMTSSTRVPAWVVAKLTANRVTEAMVNNFFSGWYGIGEDDDYAMKIEKLSDLYTFFNTKGKRDQKRVANLPEKEKKLRKENPMPPYPPISYHSNREAEKLIEYWERQYRERIDDIKKSRPDGRSRAKRK